jgi:hypothetical protein
MKTLPLVTGLLLAAVAGAAVMAQDTTSVQNGGNSATITQSGDPSATRKSVESGPGHTRIEQHNGSNSAVITQDSGSGPALPDADDDADVMPTPKPRADGTQPRANVDVYGTVRDRASPQGQANLDRLMNQLGIAPQR